ncbi:MAG: 3-phosphoshikimate 1-carboxyvinyltransferase [Ignavibacteriaceae bacterium]|nr:3-phosphoshikimate 1-carboxyvinyltransferase [Ignavibacteriaceae bacterium]
MIKEFYKIESVNGELNLPGDKSISHRAVMFSAMAKGISRIENLSDGDDVNSTIFCFEKLGVEVERVGKSAIVNGKGFKNFSKPAVPLDAGNSGTTARLISGFLAAQNFESTVIGDQSLSKRPMARVIQPLRLMGAKFETNQQETLPLKILSGANLNPINYNLPVASAQVKSAILIAALHCDEISSVRDTFFTRDHTERMLGLKVSNDSNSKLIYSSKEFYPRAQEYFVPSDISTASFFIVLALLLKSSELKIKNVGLNPSRIGILKVLKEMGADIKSENERESSNEPIGDIVVKSSQLKNIEIDEQIIPNIIDEIPILSIAGLFAEGNFKISNAKELRTKESDRIKSLCFNFRMLGLNVDEEESGFSVSGEITNRNPVFESFDDHRIAMAFSILSLLLKDGGKINKFECVSISNPNFISQLKQING